MRRTGAETGGASAWARGTGLGISAKALGATSEPFVQDRAPLAPAAVGPRLGLAICRDLARGMGGDATVEGTPGWGAPRRRGRASNGPRGTLHLAGEATAGHSTNR